MQKPITVGVLLATLLAATVQAEERRPPPPGGDRPPREHPSERPRSPAERYTLAQAMSDKAQLHTIAFNGLAFLTGDQANDTFLPPGKVSDYFGFQYLRDIDAREGGHRTDFLTRIANNMLAILSTAQRAQLQTLARQQAADVREFALMRLPLIASFRRYQEGRLPSGKTTLSAEAIQQYSAQLYELDGKIALQRARVMAEVLRSFSPAQKARLAQLRFGDSGTWPDMPDVLDKRSMSHEEHVAMMTYASEMFAWANGNAEADTYFCPERHGMYFGGFGMKTAPAMGKPNYAISTSLTGDSGAAFLEILGHDKAAPILALPQRQQAVLQEIVQVRRDISAQLRKLLKGEVASAEEVTRLSRRYGELDGRLSYWYAMAFVQASRTLTPAQKQQLMALRQQDPTAPRGPFLYSDPLGNIEIRDKSQFYQ